MNPYRSRPIFITYNRTFIVLFIVLIPLLALAAERPAKAIEWQLSETKVTSWGTVSTSKEGRLRTGIKIVGQAITKTPDASFSTGVFSIAMTAFTPAEDMPGQKKGIWYLNGNWAIMATDETAATRTTHGSPALYGVLQASLPYNPAAETGPMVADVRLQQRGVSALAGRRAKSSFSGKSNLEGMLTTVIPPALAKGVQAK